MKEPDQLQTPEEKEARRSELRAKRAASRQRIIDRLDAENRSDLSVKLEKCGEELSFTCTSCGHRHQVIRRCDNKWCPSCAPLLAHKQVERLLPVARLMQWPLYVTWTVKNYADRVGLRELRRAFAKLIKLRWFKRACRGGAASFEVSRLTDKERRRQKLSPREGLGWHPHAHALMDCRWLAVTTTRPAPGSTTRAFRERACRALNEVAEQWSLALGRPGSVKVRATFHTDAGDPTRGLKETLKYSVTSDVLEKSPEPIAPLLDELLLTRNLTTFGDWYRHPLLKKRPRQGQPCKECGDEKTMMPTALVEAFKLDKARGRAR